MPPQRLCRNRPQAQRLFPAVPQNVCPSFHNGPAPLQQPPSIQSRFEYAFRKTSERLLDKSIEEELHRHIYLYEVLAGALVRNLHSGHLPVDNHTFDTHLELAYDRLLKPFEQYFQECEKTR